MSDRLNAPLHPDTGIIVTSHTAEYTESVHTGDVLTAAVVSKPDHRPRVRPPGIWRIAARQPDES
jgi:hypothetical protein